MSKNGPVFFRKMMCLLACGLCWMAGVTHAQLTAVDESPALRVLPVGSPQEAEVTALLFPEMEALAKASGETSGNGPASLDEVNRWSERLTSALRQGGFPVGQVLMTEKQWRDVSTSGRAVFSVYPGRIDAVTLENASRMADARLQRLITRALCGNEPLEGVCFLRTSRLERATQLLQDVPGVAMEKAPQFAPGSGVGDIQVVFNLAEKGKPLQADVTLDNKGMPSTGLTRLGASASGNNYFGAGESYAASLMVTDKRMWTGALTGSMPLFDDGLRLTGGLTRQQYSINAGTPVTGVANTAQAGVLYPFTRGLDSNVWGGVSVLHSQTKTTFDDFDFSTHSTLDSMRFSLQADNGDRPQQLRGNVWSAQGALTLGHQSNDDPVLDAGPQRAGNYAKLTASGYGSYGLTASGDLFLSGRANTQLASRNLDPSEKLAAGGPDAVRAYRADEVSFDDGMIFNVGVYQRVPIASGHQLQFGAFSDYALGRVNHHPWTDWQLSYIGVPDVTNTRTLAGYGVSADWLTPFGATLSASVSKAYGFSSGSWVDPGEKPVQYWLSLTWGR